MFTKTYWGWQFPNTSLVFAECNISFLLQVPFSLWVIEILHTHFFVSKSFTNSLDMYFKILKTLLSVQYPELFWSRYTGLGFQTFESVKINSSEKRQMTDKCLELFRMETTQNFQGIYPCTPLGRTYSVPRPPDSPAAQWLSPRYTCQKNSVPKKLPDEI